MGYEYEIEKIYDYLNNGKHLLGNSFFENLCKVTSIPETVRNTENFSLKRLFVDAYIYHMNTILGKPVSYDDIVAFNKEQEADIIEAE